MLGCLVLGDHSWLSSASTQRKGLLGSSVPENANNLLATASLLLYQRLMSCGERNGVGGSRSNGEKGGGRGKG